MTSEKPTPEQLQHFLDCVICEMAHARTFVTTREKMHEIGIEQYDMVLNAARAIRNAMRLAPHVGARQDE